MQEFRPTNFTLNHDGIRFKLVRNLSLTMIALMVMSTIINCIYPDQNIISSSVGLGISIAAYVYLRWTKNHRAVSMFISVSACLLISLTFLIAKNTNYTTANWMVLNIIFTFVTLDKTWGLIISMIHFTFASTFIGFYFMRYIELQEPYSPSDTLGMILEYSVCGIGITYTLYMAQKSNDLARTELGKHNDLLLEQNETISLQNEEKDIMLKEIHHRVKNNLQVITSLLRLQSGKVTSSENSTELFDESINRVNAMALIHEKLYQDESLSNFGLSEYLRGLANNLVASYTVEVPVKVNVHVDHLHLNSKTIVPLAILFNELISNSIKHAFKGKSDGLIDMTITQLEHNFFELKYHDNGTWRERESEKGSFGLELIDSMVEQLEGECSFEQDEHGSNFTFRLTNLADSFKM